MTDTSGIKRVLVTRTSPIGYRCWTWVKELMQSNLILVDRCEDADYIFSVFHNKIFSEEQLANKSGLYNFHGGILPDYRGSCTINWAIINEEKETGVTLHTLERGVDTGSIVDIYRIEIERNDTSGTIYKKLEEVTFSMFRKWFDLLINEKPQVVPQDLRVGRLYRRKDIEKAKDLTRFVRAFEHEGKESAYYFTSLGEKIELRYNN